MYPDFSLILQDGQINSGKKTCQIEIKRFTVHCKIYSENNN